VRDKERRRRGHGKGVSTRGRQWIGDGRGKDENGL